MAIDGMTDLFLLLGHLVPTLRDLRIDGVGLQLLARRKLSLQVLLDDGARSLRVQEGGGQRALRGVRVLFLLLPLALVGLTRRSLLRGLGDSVRNVVDCKGRGCHGVVGRLGDVAGQLEAFERAIFTGEDRGRVLDVRGHEVVEAILDVREALLNVGERDNDLVYVLVGVFLALRDEDPRRVALRLRTRFAGRAGDDRCQRARCRVAKTRRSTAYRSQ
jgi:hypothetical protein